LSRLDLQIPVAFGRSQIILALAAKASKPIIGIVGQHFAWIIASEQIE
jgi:hypothetical protein